MPLDFIECFLFYILFLGSISFISSLIFISSLVLILGFACSYFSCSLRFKVRFFHLRFVLFLEKAFITMNFSLRTVFAAFLVLVCHVSIFIYLKTFFDIPFSLFFPYSSLIHWLLKNMLFDFHVFVNFPAFFLLLISIFIPL